MARLSWGPPVVMAAGDPAARGYNEPAVVEVSVGRIVALSLYATAQPLYTGITNIFDTIICF
jgi:hypothetical protein